MEVYSYQLQRFLRAVEHCSLTEVGRPAVEHYLAALHEHMKPISVHQAYRVLRTFFGWCVMIGLLVEHPMGGVTMRVPQDLPRVPEDDEVHTLLHACADTFEGRRNRALIGLLADSGLRISEALRLRIEDVNFTTGTLSVRGGKGGRDRTGHFGDQTASLLRAWLARRREVHPVRLADVLFCDLALVQQVLGHTSLAMTLR